MTKRSRSKSGVLSDHIRIGKVFKPPISQFSIEGISWIKNTLPEFLWIGLILSKYSLSPGVDLSYSVAKAASESFESKPNFWLAMASSYETLSEKGKKTAFRILSDSGKIALIQEALKPLIHFYPKCPLSFLFEIAPSEISVDSDSLANFKNVLASLYPKRDRLPVLVQVQGVYIFGITHKIHAQKGSALANLEAIKKYPDTEESLKVGASACAFCNAMIGRALKEHDSGWSSYFWKRGFELDACEYELPYRI